MHCCRCYQRKQTTGPDLLFILNIVLLRTLIPNLWIATSTAGSPRAVNCIKKENMSVWKVSPQNLAGNDVCEVLLWKR